MAQVVLDIVYRTKGMQGLAKSQQELNKASRAANTGANSIKKFDRAVARAGRSSRQASAGVKAFGAATVGATGSLKAFGAAMASYLAPVAAIAAAVGALAKSFQIAGEREADARALANGLEKIGAEKGALDSLQASADKLGKTTLFNQEDFTKGYKLLTSFRNIGLSSYEDVSKAAADMATVIGGDMNSSLLQLSKALEDPAKGLSYLSRSGTTFTEEQKEMIKSLQESGNLLGAQAEIMKVVQAQYGGAAEAAGKSGLAGAFDSMMEVLRDAGEVIGKALEPLAVGAMQLITKAVEGLGAVWNDLAANVFPSVQEALKPILDSLKNIYEAIDWNAVGQVVKTVVVGAFKALEFALRPVLWIIQQKVKAIEALIKSPIGKVLGDAFKFIANSLGQSAKEAEKLGDETERTVKPVNELKQNLEKTQKPLTDANKTTEEIKEEMQGVAKATGDAKGNADELAGSLNNAAGKANGLKNNMEGAGKSMQGATNNAARMGPVLNQASELGARFNKSLSGASDNIGGVNDNIVRGNNNLGISNAEMSRLVGTTVEVGKAMQQNAAHAGKVTKMIGAGNFEQQRALDLSALKDTSQMLYMQRQADIIENHIKENDLQGEQLAIAKQMLNQARQQQVEAAKNIDGLVLSKSMHNEIGQELDRNNTKIEQMVMGLLQGANAAGAMADNLARAGNAASGGGLGRKRTIEGGLPAGAFGANNPNPSREDIMSGKAKINHDKFGQITWDQWLYLQDNPTHGLKHYSAAKDAEREEQKKIQYEIQHGPGTYNGGNNATSVSSRAGFSSGSVNVNYTGTTLNFNGDEYVQKKDVGGIIKSATNATQSRMANSATYRLNAGMS